MKLDINTEHFIICWEVGTTIYLIQWYILKYTTDETYIDGLPKGSNSIMYNIDLNILEVLFPVPRKGPRGCDCIWTWNSDYSYQWGGMIYNESLILLNYGLRKFELLTNGIFPVILVQFITVYVYKDKRVQFYQTLLCF